MGQLDDFAALAAALRRPAATDATSTLGSWRRRVGRSCTRRAPRAVTSTSWLLDRPERAHGRLLLPPLGPRRPAGRPQPLRGGSRRVPDRPGGRRLRVPLRDPRGVPRGQRARRPGSRRCGATASSFASLREPGSAGACASCGSFDACRGGCMAAKFFTGLETRRPRPRVRLRPRRDRPRATRRRGAHARPGPFAPGAGDVSTRSLSPISGTRVMSARVGGWRWQVRGSSRWPRPSAGPSAGCRARSIGARRPAPSAVSRWTTTSRPSTSWASPRTSPTCPRRVTWPRPSWVRHSSMPVVISPTGVQAVHPRRRGPVGAGRGEPRRRDGAVELFASRADRGRDRDRRAGALPGVLVGGP